MTRSAETVAESTDPRATSPVVGVVVLVGITVILAGVAGALVAFGGVPTEPAPPVHVTASLDSTNGWPDGQRLRIVHRGGETVRVADVTIVLAVERVDARARLSGFPTRRLTAENVRGRDVFDNGFAGVDGVLDAAYTDGRWESGDAAEIRIAQGEVDVRPGDRVQLRIVHEPTNAVLADLTVIAE